ncbi:GNAT family N-acetyltransferase [Nonomuraea sp. NPDC050404]|uniref:GNAT family N-acetyltransferase n=1 Tax=Nonomuraea sp. NPDC050404 TaxID=3155783 RepID=UPI0034003B57
MTEPLLVPELPAGDRFLLRPWRLEDVVVVKEASTDPYIPLITTVPPVYTEEEGVAFIHRQWSRSTDRTGYSFAIADTVTGRAVRVLETPLTAGEKAVCRNIHPGGRPGGGGTGTGVTATCTRSSQAAAS